MIDKTIVKIARKCFDDKYYGLLTYEGAPSYALQYFVKAILDAKDSPKAQTGGSVEDFATRLFDLEGFMLLETYRGKPAVTVTFPDQKQANRFHDALVALSRHRRPKGSTDV